ncbi:hypothetical protein BJ944DRAFT_272071 [Cunninghamella echinulata]|nr:hypothetical protein BJ944DRAFT_272071 [Cunninghamella echinulata]
MNFKYLFSLVIALVIIQTAQACVLKNYQRCANPPNEHGPGVGPTYEAGKACGFKTYISNSNSPFDIPKSWKTCVKYNKCFHNYCKKAGKNYIYSNY